MACTTYDLSPESRKPLHAQVTSLRAERVSLLEQNRKLRDERDELKKASAEAARVRAE